MLIIPQFNYKKKKEKEVKIEASLEGFSKTKPSLLCFKLSVTITWLTWRLSGIWDSASYSLLALKSTMCCFHLMV